MAVPTEDSSRAGLLSALGAYCIWGLIALYWALLSEAGDVEILAHRIVWSLIFVLFLIIAKHQLGATIDLLKALILHPAENKTLLLILATVFASGNWLVNIVGVTAGRVVELGLGTFLTPLMTMAIGVVIFSERISKTRALAIALAAIGVGVLITGLDRFPWIAILVSTTWATYGALKKKIVIDPLKSVAIEHILMVGPALVYLLSFNGIFVDHFINSFSSGLSWALMGTGIVTSVPMVLFSLAAQRLPMTVLGIIQFLSPVLTFLLGVFVFKEEVTAAEIIALGFILSAVALYIIGNRKAHAAAQAK